MDIYLRVFAGAIVTESKLLKSSKLQLLNFIQKEGTDAQIKALLLDGSIVALDEQAEEIVNARFEISEAGGKVAKFRKSVASVAAHPIGRAVAGAGLIASGMAPGVTAAKMGIQAGVWALYRVIRAKYDKCTKHCGTFKLNLPKRQFCMAKCKVGKVQGELAAAIKSKNKEEITKKKTALAKAKQTFANYKKSSK